MVNWWQNSQSWDQPALIMGINFRFWPQLQQSVSCLITDAELSFNHQNYGNPVENTNIIFILTIISGKMTLNVEKRDQHFGTFLDGDYTTVVWRFKIIQAHCHSFIAFLDVYVFFPRRDVKINMIFVIFTCLPSFWWLNESSASIIRRDIGRDIGW